jgi:hypothetical protein
MRNIGTVFTDITLVFLYSLMIFQKFYQDFTRQSDVAFKVTSSLGWL